MRKLFFFIVFFFLYISTAFANPERWGSVGSNDTVLNQMSKSFTNNYLASGIPDPDFNFMSDYLTRPRDVNLLRLKDFINVKQLNNAITGGVGISGAAYVPEVDLLFMVDNNSLNVSIYQAGNLTGTEFGNITFSGFTDTEALTYLYTVYDANGFPDLAVFAVSEEQNNTFVLFSWDLQATSGTITKASWPVIAPTGMWTPDATLGMEGIAYNPYLNVIYAAKQDTPFEFRVIPLDGTLTPAATEPFDAEALWGATMPAINDLAFDWNTKTCLAIGDATGAASTNQDIMQFNCQTGAIIQHWDNYVVDLNFPTASWGQSEGIAISPDGNNLFVTSEGNEAAWLTRNTNNWSRVISTAVGNVGAGEDVLITTLIPSGIQAQPGDAIEFKMWGTFAANANSKRVECDYGATPVAFIDSGAQLQNGGSWTVTGRIVRTGAATQDISSVFTGPPTLFPSTPAFVTDNETLANAITIDCRGEGVADNDIVQEGLELKYISSSL